MANWSPVSGQVLNHLRTAAASGGPASGYYLKFYDTSNVAISMASASDGSGLLAKALIDSSGYALNGSSARFVPYINQDFKVALYTNSTDADADTTGNADYFIGPILRYLTSADLGSKDFATLALAVASTTIEDGDTLNIEENTAGNKGGAIWDVVLSSTVTEDAYVFVQCTGVGTLSLVHRGQGMVDVSEIGAHPGATATVNTAAIKAAFAIYKELYFPPGTYLVTPTLHALMDGELTSRDGYNIKGYGCTLQWEAGSSAESDSKFFSFVDSDDILIEGFTLDGNKANLTVAAYRAIQVYGGDNCILRDMNIINSEEDGMYFRGSAPATLSTYPTNTLIENVNTDDAGRNGLSVIGCVGFIVRGGTYAASKGNPGAGIDLEPNLADVHGIKDVIIEDVTIENNNGRGIVITGNTGGVGETAWARNVQLKNIVCRNNALDAGATAQVGGCDIAVYLSEDVTIDGFVNDGQTNDPEDDGLIYIWNGAIRPEIKNCHFSQIKNPTNTKSLIYIDSSDESYRPISDIYANDCDCVIISGGKFSNISGVHAQDCIGSFAIGLGAQRSTLRNVNLENCSRIETYATDGTVEGVTIIDPPATAVNAIRFYGARLTVRDVTVRDSGTASTTAFQFDNSGGTLTDLHLEGIRVSDNGAYWDTNTNVYLISSAASFAGYKLRNVFPSPLTGSEVWDPGSIAAGASETNNISVTRGDIGDAVRVQHTISPSTLISYGVVTSADEVKVTLFNPSLAAVDLGSHTVTVEVLK